MPRLQKELFENGRDYVRRFAQLLKQYDVEKRLKKTHQPMPDKRLHLLNAELHISTSEAIAPTPEAIVPIPEAIKTDK